MKHAIKLLPLLIGIGLLGGCATTGDVETLRAEMQQVEAKADAAMRTAEEAQRTSAEALQTAQDAKATSEATEEKIDRMFKKAMHK